MKKIKQYLLIFPLFLAFFAWACVEEVVVPPKTEITFDSARFEWKVDTIISNGIIGVWSNDSDNVYCIDMDNNSLIHLSKGIQTIYYLQSFYPRYIGGISNNEIYIAGSIFANGSYAPHLKRWDGYNFYDYTINIPGAGSAIYPGAIKNSNEMWFVTENYIIKFDGTNFIPYPQPLPNSFVFIGQIFYGTDNVPRFIYYDSYFFPYTDSVYSSYLFEFKDTNWVMVYDNTQVYGESYIALHVINGRVCGTSTRCLYDFTGKGFSKLVCPYNEIWWYIDGMSFNDFICGTNDYPRGLILTHWNGIRWSKEVALPSFEPPVPRPAMKVVNSNLYCIVFGWRGTIATLIYRGIRKCC